MRSSSAKRGSANKNAQVARSAVAPIKKAAAEFSGGGFFETNDRERGELSR
jgi:hypothetical protein